MGKVRRDRPREHEKRECGETDRAEEEPCRVPPSRRHRGKQGGWNEKHGADRTLDEERDPCGRPERDGEALRRRAPTIPQGTGEAPHTERDRGGEQHVRVRELPTHEHVDGANLGEAGDEAEGSPEPPRAEIGQADGDRHRSEHARQPSRPFLRGPEGRHGGRHRPVKDGRLLQPRLLADGRNEPASALEHLASALRVASLVIVERLAARC
jgi:hypothetical protein